MDDKHFLIIEYTTTGPLPSVVTNHRTLKNIGILVDLVIDGITLSVGDTVLVKNQVDTSQNGTYEVTQIHDSNNNIPFILQRINLNVNNLIVVFIKLGNTLSQTNWCTDLGCPYTPGVTLQIYTKYISTDLQDAYNKDPEIIINPTIGPVVIRDSSTPSGGDLFEITNNNGSTTFFSVDATGTTIDGKLTVTGLIDPTGTQFVEQASNPGVVATGNGTIWVRNNSPNVLVFTDNTGTDTVLGGGAGSQSLQQTYNLSGSGNIILDATRGALAVSDNATPIGANLFEVQNNAGTSQYLSVDATGVTIDGKLTVTGLIDPTGLTLSEQAINPGMVSIGDGTIWIRNDIPNTVIFTDDIGTNYDIAGANAAPIFAGLTVNGDSNINGNLVVTGTTISAQSENVLINDNYLCLNQNYTTTIAQKGGICVNYLPTAITDTVASPGFIAGISSTSNPTVGTVSATTFSTSDIIMIVGANNTNNNGIFEVLSHVANVLTIRGIGTVGTVEGFTRNQFTTDVTVAGTITQVNITILQTGTDGLGKLVKDYLQELLFVI